VADQDSPSQDLGPHSEPISAANPCRDAPAAYSAGEAPSIHSAEWLRLIVENLNDVFWVAEVDGVEPVGDVSPETGTYGLDINGLMARWRFTYVSSSFERLLGYSFTSSPDLNPYGAVPEAFHTEVERQLCWYIGQAMSAPEGTSFPNAVVLPLATATGEPRWCETSARVLYDRGKKLLRFVGVTRDVTQAYLAQEAVRTSEEKLRAISDAAQDAVVVMGADGKAVHCNAAAERMFGYRKEEILGRDIHTLLTPRRLHEKLRRGIEEFRRAGQGPVVGNVVQSEAVRRDGSEFPVEIAVSPLMVGGQRSAVGIIRDITDRALAEEAVRREQRSLAQLLDVYEGHRKMATYEIHDGVTQPLVSALMTLDAFSQARNRYPDASWHDFEAAVAMLREALAETRRFMSGMRPPVLDELGVVTALEHLIREQRVSGTAAIDYHCDVSFARLAPPLETTIFRIVQEGLVNARRHSRSGKIRVEFVEQGDRLRIAVQDWGVGFVPAQVPVDHFGLEGIRQRAAAIGGTARIESTPGAGTRILVDLPLLKERPDES